MLGPIISQGVKLEEGQVKPREYSLPNDDPQALLAICQVLHWQNQEVTTLSTSLILDISILANKYDMVWHLLFAAQYWTQFNPSLLPFSTTKSCLTRARTCWKLALASYGFNRKLSFFKFSDQLVGLNMKSYLAFAQEMTEPSHYALGLRLCCMLT